MDTNPGFFSDPVTTLPDMGPVNLPTTFPNPYEGIGPEVAPSAPSNVDPFAGQLERDLSKGPSFAASTEPTFFDWDTSNADRYLNSEYYQQLGFRPDRDNETLYGNMQTFGDTMQQALAGAGELAWNTFVDGWKGWGRLVNSLVHWDASQLMGTPDELEELSKEQNRIMNKYAIFRTPESEGSIFNKQFLGDMIQQSGFAVGTMAQFAAEELLTAGAATLFKSGTTALKLSNLLKWAKTGEVAADMKKMDDVIWKTETAKRLYEGLKNASNVTKYVPVAGSLVDEGLKIWSAANRGTKGLELAGMTFNAFRRTISETNMAFTEARMEAAGTYSELKEKLLAEAQKDGDISPDEMNRIEQQVQAAAWSNFKVNAGVISFMNRWEFDNLFRTFGSDKRALRGMAEAGEEAAKHMIDPRRVQQVTAAAAKDVTDATGKVTVKAGEEFTQVYSKGAMGTFGNLRKIASDFGRKQAAWEATKSVGGALFKWEVGEGLQELIQEGSNIAIKDYYTDLYLNKKGNKGYNDYYVDKAIDQLMNTNGLKIFLMGAVTGRLLSPIERGLSMGRDLVLGNHQAEQKEVEQSASDLNKFYRDMQGLVGESVKKTVEEYYSDPARYAPEGVANLRVQNRAAEVMQEALTNNDKYLYEHAKDGAFAKAVIAAKKLNMLESLTDTIRAYGEHFDEKAFHEAFKVDFKEESDRTSVKEYMNKLADNIESFSRRFDALREKYSDVVRPEKYVGEDREKMKRVSRGLDDAVEWVAVSEYRAQQASKRGLAIIDQAAQLASIKDSAHLAFRVLGDDEQMEAETGLLKQEVDSLQSGEQTEDVKQQLALKKEQLESLQEFQKLAQPYKETSKDSPVAKQDMNPDEAGLLMDHMDKMLGSLKGYVNAINKNGGVKQLVTDADAQDFFFLLNDYRKLDKFQRKLLDVNAYLSNSTNFASTFHRILDALHYTREEKIDETLNPSNGAAAKAAASTKNKDQDLTAQQVREGKPLESYHGFRTGDKVRDTKTDSTYTILQLTTKGVEWQDTEDAKKYTLSLERFDRLVAENHLERTPGEQRFKVVFGQGEKRRTIDKGVEGVFIVEDSSQEKPFYRVVNADNAALDREGKVVPEGEEPEVYGSDEEAKLVRDGIVEGREKAQKELETPFVFDGKEMKHGTVLVKQEGGKKERFTVVSKGVGSPEEGGDHQQEGASETSPSPVTKGDNQSTGDASGTVGEDANSQRKKGSLSVKDKIELEPLGGGEKTTIDNLVGYELATEATQRRPVRDQKEGAFRLRAVNVLVSASGVPQENEDQEEADARLQEIIRSTPPKDLEDGLVIRIRRNDTEQEPRLAKEDTDQENRHLQEREGPLVVELVYDNEVIGTLPYFDRYDYVDENRAEHKMDAISLDQFEKVFDTGGEDVAAQYDAFQFFYTEAKKVYTELQDRVRDKGSVDIKGSDLQSAFRVYSHGGSTAVLPKATQPLDSLAYTGVNGKRVVLVQSLERDAKNLENRTKLVLVEGGLAEEEQKKLEDRIEKARARDGRDLANGLGDYVAVVELPNGELRFVPLDLKEMTAEELKAVVERLNAQSEKTIKNNWTAEGTDDPNFLGSYNGKFNGELLNEFFISVPGQQNTAWIDLSLSPSGAVTVTFQNPHTEATPQEVVINGGAEGKPVSFTNFSDFLQKVNKAIAEHDAAAKPGERIGLQLKAEHFKKHLAPLKELTAKDGFQRVDFKAVGQLSAFVSEEVVGPASLMVTSKSTLSDAIAVLLEHEARKQAAETTEEDERDDEDGEKQVTGKGDTEEKQPKGGGEEKKDSKSPSKKKVKAVVRREKNDTTNKGTGDNQGAKKDDAQALGRELKRLEAEVKRLTNKFRTEALAEAQKKQEETAVNGKKEPLDIIAIKNAGSQHPEVVALQKRIREIQEQSKQNKPNAANKTLTKKELEKSDVEDIERFRQWMQDNLPDFITVEEKDLIAQNMNRYGINVGRLIYRLKELGQPGIEAKIEIDVKAPFKYHEAFHTVFRLLLSDEEIDKYLAIARTEVAAKLRKEGKTLAGELKELKKLVNSYHVEITGRELTDKELETLYYEEHLADRFDAWKMDATKEKEGWLNQLFHRIYTFVRNIVKKFTPGELEVLFMNMDKGAYKQAALVDNRYTKDPHLAVAPQVVLKSIRVGEQLVTDEDGNDVWVGEYLSQAKATGLASSIAGTYYARMLERKAGLVTVDPEAKTDPEELRISVSDEVLNGVMNDYAKLYDKDNLQYLQLLGNKETIGEYYTVAAELDKLKTLLDDKRDVLREAVEQHMRTIALMRSEEEQDADDVNDEIGDRAMVDWHQNKESIGGFDSLSEWVRQYISTTTYIGKDAFGNTELREGEPLLQAVDTSRVYSGILKMAAGIDDPHQFLLRLQTMAQQNHRGYASEHCAHFINRFFSDMGLVVTPEGYDLQKKEKAYLFNAVIKGFQKHAVDYLLFNKDLQTNNTTIIASNRYESKRKQFSTWYNAFNHLFYERYKRTSEARKAAFVESRVKGLQELQRLMRIGKISQPVVELKSVEISQQLKEDLGIHLHPLYIQSCLLESITNDELAPPQLALLQRLPNIALLGLGDIELLLLEIERGKNPFVWNKDATDVEGYKVSERDEGRALASHLMDVAEANALFDESVNVTSFKNANLETVYGHQLPTFHLVRVSELSRLLKQPGRVAKQDAYLAGNLLANSADMQQMAADLKVVRINGMNSYNSGDSNLDPYYSGYNQQGVTYGDFTEREMLLSLFELYGAGQLYYRSDGTYFHSSRHLVRVLEASNTGDTVNLPIIQAIAQDGKDLKLSAKAVDAMVQEVKREFDRIRQVKKEMEQIAEEKRTGKRVTKEIEGYHNGAEPRGLALFKTGGMLGALAKELEKEAQGDHPQFRDFEKRLKEQLQTYWMGKGGQLDQTIALMKELGIIQEKNGKLENVLLPSFMGKKKEAVGKKLIEHLKLTEDNLLHNVGQVLVNDFLNTQSFNQLLLGDQAVSLEGFVDMVKRAKGANGSGPSTYFEITAPEMGIKHDGRNSHVLHIDDPMFWGRYANKMHRKADGQMWMTTKFLRYTLFGLGRLTPVRAALLDKLERGEAVDVDEIFGAGGTIAQGGQNNPLKLVYYDGKRYIKISSFVLTPELTSVQVNGKWRARKGYEELHALREKLENFEERNQTTCLAVPASGSKGEKANVARGVMPQLENGTLVDPISDWNFQKLDNRFWRLQTENPSNKLEITDPTQAKQLVLGEQDDRAEVWFPWSQPDEPITVGELKKIYLKDAAQRQKVKYRNARNQIFTFDEALKEIKTSADLQKVTPRLDAFLKKAVDTLRISAADSQLLEFFSLDGGGHQRFDLNHPATLNKFTQLFLAYFTKGVLNEKVPGRVYTLVSNYGMKVIRRVLEVGEDGQPKRTELVTRRQYEQNPEAYEEALEWGGDPNGTAEERQKAIDRRLFFNLKETFEKNGKKPTYIVDDLRHMVPEYALDSKRQIKKDGKGNEIILGYYTEYMTAPHSREEMEFYLENGNVPDAVAKGFGVRIPTDDKHSMVTMKLVDYLPAHYGSSIVTAPEVLEISGADFDADKLFASTKEYYTKRALEEEDLEDPLGNKPFYHYYSRRQGEPVEFVPYGTRTDEKGRFNEYVLYQKRYNKAFKKQYQEFLQANEGYRALQKDAHELAHKIEERLKKGAELLPKIKGKKLSQAEMRDMALEEDEQLIEWKLAHKEKVRQLKMIQREATLATLRELSLPTTGNDYAQKIEDEGEQNIGVLNNRLVDAKIQFLGNKHMMDGGESRESKESLAGDSSGKRQRRRNAIAFELTSVQALKDLVEDFKVIFKDSKELMAILEEGNVDPDTFLGKVLAFRNNKEGAKNIGPAVNSMLAYTLLNIYKVRLREKTEENRKNGEEYNRPIWRFKLNGVEFDSYGHTHAYSHTIEHADGTKEHVFEGERIMHTISAIVQAMTDNAKERLAAKLGLNMEAVGLVSNLAAQGVPLSSAVSLMLQPAVREYYKLTKNLKASVKTEDEENQSKYAIGENLLNSLGEGLSKQEKETGLTDELLRDNILQNGSNKTYQYAVLNAFMKLRAQTQYFTDVAAVMKVVKGMNSSHEADGSLEEKMDQLGLFDSDEVFKQKHIPFDLRQALTGKNPNKAYNNIVAQGIRHFKEIRELQKRVFIERTETFQQLMNMIRDNLRVRWYDSAEFEKKIKQDLLSFLSIKAYKKMLLDAGRLNRALSLSPAMIFDGDAMKMPEGFKDIVDVVMAIRKALPDNVFIQNYLNVLPTHVEDDFGREIVNPANGSGLNKAEINTWAKLDPLQMERMQDSFMDIVSNDDTRDYAWALFHYLLVKDGGQFRNGSFIRFVPPALFKDFLDATARVNEVFMKGREDGVGFERAFGQQDFELMNEFVHGYLTNATNVKYLHKVDINQSTADLDFSRFTSTASVSETKTDKLSEEEREEVKRYVPETFQVSKDGSEIVIDMTGGIREEGERPYDKYDELENAKYGKNMTSLKLRGFTINNSVPYTKRKKPGDKRAEKGTRTGIEFPYVLKREMVTEQGTKVLMYRLAEIDFRDKENHKHRGSIDPTYYFGVGGTKAMGTHARYVLVGSPNGQKKVWGGIFLFGPMNTDAFPRERGFYGNYEGYDVTSEPVHESLPIENRSKDEGKSEAKTERLYDGTINGEPEEDYLKRMDALIRFHTEFKVTSSYDAQKGLVSFTRKDVPVSEEEREKLLPIYSERTGIPMEQLTGAVRGKSQQGPAFLEDTHRETASGQEPESPLQDFMDEYNVDQVEVVDGAFVFYRGGEVAPGQEELERAFLSLLHQNQGMKLQFDDTDGGYDDDDDVPWDDTTSENTLTQANRFNQDDTATNEPPDLDELARRMQDDGPLGC